MPTGVDPSALRAAREAAGLTQHELAREIGVAGGERVSRWELGTSAPRPETLRRIADSLAVDPMTLIHFDTDVPDLRAIRLAAGLGTLEVARKAHVSIASYLRWEAGHWKRLPGREHLHSLARILGVPAGTIAVALEQTRPSPASSDD